MNVASLLVGLSSGAMTLLSGGDLQTHSGALREISSRIQADVETEVLAASGTVIVTETSPLPRLEERETLLTFGMHVTPDPATNPINPPERFTGYHTAIDFEILPGEEDAAVPVSAIADGDVLFSGEVGGYGGVVVQSAMINGEQTTILYGHLSISSLLPVGARLQTGDVLGELAPAQSKDSGYTRKHLHMGIHKGTNVEFLGYVETARELDAFIDPMTVIAGD